MSLHVALAKVRDTAFLLDAIRAAEELTATARRTTGPEAVRLLTSAIAGDDQLLSIAAVQALGVLPDDAAAAAVSDLLSDARPYLREHAAWALGSRTPWPDALGPLVAGVYSGGFPTVIHQRALRRWAQTSADEVALALECALLTAEDPAGRARLVDTLGLVPGGVAAWSLLRLAGDEGESSAPRAAAVAALGSRGRSRGDGSGDAVRELVRRLVGEDGALTGVARLAAFDLGGSSHLEPHPSRPGLSIGQLFLHADLDRELSRAGAGDNGGIATMLVRLGDALVAEPGVERVLTMSRGSVDAALAALTGPTQGHLLTPVPLMSEAVDAAGAWPLSVAAERGIRRVLTANGRVDVLHLRMADVGSMAAAAVAARLGIPTVFTLAPDPHAVIHALDMTGALTRANFGAVDEREHYWFRTGLVHRLAISAQHCALFPRPKLRDQLRDLLGVDIDDQPGRYTVVPEGIDLSVAKTAKTDVHANRRHPALLELERLVAGLPEHRRGLPLAVSVGRLHRVKGMATVVGAWATRPALRDRCNLLIIGGDLTLPSIDEQGQLTAIDEIVAADPEAARGLLIPGHRPNDVVAHWLAAAAVGLGDLVAPGGVYVCGSLKEEFGLAIIEAMAAGLLVVAPDGGGPATYIEEGVTGFLVDTRSPSAVGAGMVAALDLVHSPGDDERVARARRLITGRFTLAAMAHTLAGIYAQVTAPVGSVAAS